MLNFKPVCHNAVTATLPVSSRCAAQQLDLAGVQRNQQINHEAGIVDGLAENRAFFVLHQLLLPFFAQAGPQAELFGCQVHGGLLLATAGCRRVALILQRPQQTQQCILFMSLCILELNFDLINTTYFSLL